MIDFALIRQRANTMQENSGLGTPEHAISQDVLALLDVLGDSRKMVTVMSSELEALRIDHVQAGEQISEIKAERDVATQRLSGLEIQRSEYYALYRESCEKINRLVTERQAIEAERDEARELHAKVCAQCADLTVRLNRASKIDMNDNDANFVKGSYAQGYAHGARGMMNKFRLALRPEPIGSIVCTSRDIDPETYAGMVDCGGCGEVHHEPPCDGTDPEVITQHGAFVGPVPHE